ncbi:MFS transporter [Solwaraspora sp. WMMA2101]|uniref:MFS transporter n=1 Tax=Solwaraspora sp. WMMA2101 TaxID=3404124 RepID=UPI003B941065
MADTGSTGTASRRAWLGLAVLALPTLLLALDLSVLFLALPRISVDLSASAEQQLWIVDIYGFMIAGFLLTMGAIGDRVGRRRLLLVGAAVFAAASVAAAFAPSAEWLIVARALLGVAGATLMPSTLALLTTMFRDPGQRALAVAVWMSCFIAGTALGPLVGGVLLEFFWWGSVFLIGVPVMAILLVAGPVLLPEQRHPQAARPDPPSVLLALAAVLLAVYGGKELARTGSSLVAWLAVAAGVGLAVGFVARQRRRDDALLDLGIFRHRAVPPALAVLVVGGVVLGGTTLAVTQFLQLVQGLSPLWAGVWLIPSTAAMIVGSLTAPVLARRIRPGFVIAGGLVIAAAGYALLTRLDGTGALPVLVIGWSLAMFGNGLPAGLGVDLVVGSVPPRQAGIASGTSETATELGLATGIGLLGSVVTATYRAELARDMPAAVPSDLHATVLDSVNTALVTSGSFPDLLAPARDAYASGFVTVSLLSAILSIGLAVLAAVALRHVPPYGDTPAAAIQDPAESADVGPAGSASAG